MDTDVIEHKAEKPAVEVNQLAEIPGLKMPRPRNYSFKHKNPDKLETIDVDGKQYLIPAAIGSTYWAILKVCYERHDQPVYVSTLQSEVEKLFIESGREENWKTYCSKGETTIYSKASQKRSIQKASPWGERLVNNAKTLTRLGGESAYGKRLFERGHALKYSVDGKGQYFFMLHTDITNISTTKKSKKTKTDDRPA